MPLDKNYPRLKKGGRKGYDYEEAQLKKMRRLLNKDLAIAERLQNSKELNSTDKEKLQILDPKYIDIIIKRWEDFTGLKAEKI